MSFFLPDTNIIQAKDFSFEKLYKPLCFSAVVFNELMTACNDRKELKAYQKGWKDALADKILIVPTIEDWFEAGRIQFLLAQDKEKRRGRKIFEASSESKTRISFGLFDCRKLQSWKYNRYNKRQWFLGNPALSQKVEVAEILGHAKIA